MPQLCSSEMWGPRIWFLGLSSFLRGTGWLVTHYLDPRTCSLEDIVHCVRSRFAEPGQENFREGSLGHTEDRSFGLRPYWNRSGLSFCILWAVGLRCLPAPSTICLVNWHSFMTQFKCPPGKLLWFTSKQDFFHCPTTLSSNTDIADTDIGHDNLLIFLSP